MVKLSLLRQIPNISELSPQTLQIVSERGFIQARPQGYDIIVEGMPAEYCYIIISGHVRALKMSLDGRIQVFARFGAGYPANIISLLSKEKTNRATIETITKVKILTLDAITFNILLRATGRFLSHALA